MNILWNFLKDTRILLALSIVEIVLAVAGFGANYYNLFYGVLRVENTFPTLQFLAFIVFIPLHGYPLVNGIYLVVSCTHVLCGHQNTTRFGSYQAMQRNMGVFVCSGICLELMVLAEIIAFAYHAEPCVASLGVWGAAYCTFQAKLTGHVVMLGSILIQEVAFVVALLIYISLGSAIVYHDLIETEPLIHLGSQKSQPPLRKKMNDHLPDAYSIECLLSNEIAS